MRDIGATIGTFIFGIALVWFLTMLVTSIMAFIYMDSSFYMKVIPYLDPRNFIIWRVLTLVWAVASIYIGLILAQLG